MAHEADPAAYAYVPAMHCVQVLALDAPTALEALPGAHGRQTVLADAPTVREYVPAGQLVHAAEPVLME